MSSVIGIDLSLTATGVANSRDGRFTIKTAADGDSVENRLTRIEDIAAAISNYAQGCDLAVIEGPSYGQRQQAGEHLRAGLWWLTVAALVGPCPNIIEVPPATLKKFATGKGNATKPDMRMALFQRTGLDLRDDNQVDACWLRELGLRLLGEPTIILPKTHLIALDKIAKVPA
jgi:hypothetical protein